jgi:lysozyme
MEMMKMSPAGRRVLIQREGKKLRAYLDSVGVWTIGVGHTSAAGPPNVTPGLTITDAECDQLLARDLVQYEDAVNKAVTAKLNQNQFDALTSFCFNVGTGGFTRSTVVKRLNAGDTVGAADAMLMWNKPPEIMGRRQSERKQFMEPPATNMPLPPPPDVPPIKPPAKPKSNTGPIVGTVAAGAGTAAAAHKQGMSATSVMIAVAVVIALVIGGVVLWRKIKRA